jgi:NADH:ubiquinone oxidoreductase subunit 6 (subunit J)
MTLKAIFTVNSVYAFLFGVGFMFFPALCCSLIGFTLAGDAALIARCMGIFVLCTGVLTFFARNAEKSAARRAILISLLALYVLLIAFKLLLNMLWGFPLNIMFALLYVFHIGLIAGYGYHLSRSSREI